MFEYKLDMNKNLKLKTGNIQNQRKKSTILHENVRRVYPKNSNYASVSSSFVLIWRGVCTSNQGVLFLGPV